MKREEHTVLCKRCAEAGEKLAAAPLPGELGMKIWQNTCKTCWREWLSMGTKVINEYQLDLNTHAGASTFDKHMLEFLNL